MTEDRSTTPFPHSECKLGVPFGMSRMRPEFLDSDQSIAVNALFREEPDEEEEDEEKHDGDKEDNDGDEGYSE